MSVTVCIPYRPVQDRPVAYEHVRQYYADAFGDWPVIIRDDPSGGLFATGRAANACLLEADTEIVVYQDADSLVPEKQLRLAVSKALTSDKLVKAFTRYDRIDRETTAGLDVYWHVFAGGGVEWSQEPVAAAGVYACKRAGLLAIGGFDPRFDGWGYDDIAQEFVAGAVLGIERVPGPLYHLHHERRADEEEGEGGSPQFQANEKLCRRYEGSAGDPDELLRIRWEVSW